MFKEAGLRSPRTQLTKVQIEISVRWRRTEATSQYDTHIKESLYSLCSPEKETNYIISLRFLTHTLMLCLLKKKCSAY